MKGISSIAQGVCAGLFVVGLSAQAVTLNEVVSEALLEDPSANAALNVFKASEQRLRSEKAGYYPTVDATAQIGYERDDDPGSNINTNNVALSIKHNLFQGFATLNQVRSANSTMTARQWELLSQLEDKALELVNAYMGVMEQLELLELAEDNLATHESIYEQIKKRADQGLARHSDLVQVEGRRARAESNLVQAKNQLNDAMSSYHVLVGEEASDLQFPHVDVSFMPTSLDGVLAHVAENNPRLLAADWQVAAYDYNYQAQKATFMPSVDWSVSHTYGEENNNGGDSDSDLNDTTAVLSMSYNLFSGGRDSATLQQRAYETEEQRFRKDIIMRDVEEQTRVAWSAMTYLAQQRVFMLQHERASMETLAAYREQFNLGKRTLLDLLDSENELFQSSNDLVRTVYKEARAKYQLLAVTGELLNQLDFVAPEGWGEE